MINTPGEFSDGQQGLAESQPAASGGAQGEGQTPLLLQDMQFTEEAMRGSSSGSVARPAVVVGMIVVAAVGTLFAMRQFGLGPALSLAEVAVEYKPEETTTGVSAGKVLADLERSRRAIQVPADHITQDPFELDAGADINTPAIDPDLARRAEAERRREAREARLLEIQTAFDKLQLQSVMLGSRPVARINGSIYRVGMTVDELFTVTSIEGRDVTLTAEGQSYVLSLNTDPNDTPSRGRRR